VVQRHLDVHGERGSLLSARSQSARPGNRADDHLECDLRGQLLRPPDALLHPGQRDGRDWHCVRDDRRIQRERHGRYPDATLAVDDLGALRIAASPDEDPDTDDHADPDGYTHEDPDTHAYPNPDSDPDTHAVNHSNAHAYPDTDCDADADSDADQYPGEHVNQYADEYAHEYADDHALRSSLLTLLAFAALAFSIVAVQRATRRGKEF